MHAQLPSLDLLQTVLTTCNVVQAVVDWNPSGMLIYSIYKYGSGARRQGLAAQHALPGLQLLAVRAEMLQDVPQHVVQARS